MIKLIIVISFQVFRNQLGFCYSQYILCDKRSYFSFCETLFIFVTFLLLLITSVFNFLHRSNKKRGDIIQYKNQRGLFGQRVIDTQERPLILQAVLPLCPNRPSVFIKFRPACPRA